MSQEFWVHLASSADRWDQEILKEGEAQGFKLTFGSEPPDSSNYQILVAGRPSQKLLAASPDLERLVIPWAGLPKETRQELKDFPQVAVHNLHHNDQATAELAMGLLLAAARRIVPMDAALRQGDWRPRYEGPYGVELHGKQALVLGYGSIGRRVAELCQAFGMSVQATRRSLKDTVEEGDVVVHPADDFASLLSAADVLIICLPLTPETEQLIGRAELASLPPNAILINVGRGEILDEWATYRALKEGNLSAAGLDVWYQYPQAEAEREQTWPAEAPFWELENVVLSPHRAGMVQSTNRQRSEALVELLSNLAQGNTNQNEVEVNRGY